MSRADRAAWASARTVAGLGGLGARWLEGDLASQPAYAPGFGPDPETEPLIPVLARLNRAGFFTTGSQPAFSGWGHGGVWWDQRAAVEGFAGQELAFRLNDAAWGAGLFAIVHAPATLPRWRYRYGGALTVTRRDGAHHTYFGVQLPRRHIRDPWLGYGICHRDAVKALCGAWQVTVIDPGWGRDDVLWRVLEPAGDIEEASDG